MDRVPGAFVTGSFIDDLTREYSSLGSDAATLGVRINPHVVISRRLHFDSFTKASFVVLKDCRRTYLTERTSRLTLLAL